MSDCKQCAEKDKEIERLTNQIEGYSLTVLGDRQRMIERREQYMAALEAENQLLKSNLANANENWRRVLEERDRMIAIIKEADLNVDWRM